MAYNSEQCTVQPAKPFFSFNAEPESQCPPANQPQVNVAAPAHPVKVAADHDVDAAREAPAKQHKAAKGDAHPTVKTVPVLFDDDYNPKTPMKPLKDPQGVRYEMAITEDGKMDFDEMDQARNAFLKAHDDGVLKCPKKDIPGSQPLVGWNEKGEKIKVSTDQVKLANAAYAQGHDDEGEERQDFKTYQEGRPSPDANLGSVLDGRRLRMESLKPGTTIEESPKEEQKEEKKGPGWLKILGGIGLGLLALLGLSRVLK